MPKSGAARAEIEARLLALRTDGRIRTSFEIKADLRAVRTEMKRYQRETGRPAQTIRPPVLDLDAPVSTEPLTEAELSRNLTYVATQQEPHLLQEYELARARERFKSVRVEITDTFVEGVKNAVRAEPSLRRLVTHIYTPERGAWPDTRIVGSVPVPTSVLNPEWVRYQENLRREPALVQRDRDLQRTEGRGILPRGEVPPRYKTEMRPEAVLLLRMDWEKSELTNEERPIEKSGLDKFFEVVETIGWLIIDVTSLIDGVALIRWGGKAAIRWMSRRAIGRSVTQTAAQRSAAIANRMLSAESRGLSAQPRTLSSAPARSAGAATAVATRPTAAASRVAARRVTRASAEDVRQLAERLRTWAPKSKSIVRERAARYVLERASKIAQDDETLRAIMEIFNRAGRNAGQWTKMRAAAGEFAVLEQLMARKSVVEVRVIASKAGGKSPDFAVRLSTGEVQVFQAEVQTVTRAPGRVKTHPRGERMPPELRARRDAIPRFSDEANGRAFIYKMKKGQITDQGVIVVHLPYGPPQGVELISRKTLDAINLELAAHPEVLELWLSVPSAAGRNLWRVDRNAGTLGIVDRLPGIIP